MLFFFRHPLALNPLYGYSHFGSRPFRFVHACEILHIIFKFRLCVWGEGDKKIANMWIVCFWVSQAFHVSAHMFRRYSRPCESCWFVFVWMCACVRCMYIFVVENKVFIHKALAAGFDELTFLPPLSLIRHMQNEQTHTNDQKRNDKLNITVHQYTKWNMKDSNDSSNNMEQHRFACALFLSRSFAHRLLFNSNECRTFRYGMHEKWKRNDDQTKEIAYSNNVKHTQTLRHTHIRTWWMGWNH